MIAMPGMRVRREWNLIISFQRRLIEKFYELIFKFNKSWFLFQYKAIQLSGLSAEITDKGVIDGYNTSLPIMLVK